LCAQAKQHEWLREPRLRGNGTIARKAIAAPFQGHEVPMNRETPKAGFPYWFFAILIPLGMLLLSCGGVMAHWLTQLWHTPNTQKVGGPVAVVKQSDPQEEIKTRSAQKSRLKPG
jgi:hypothetical protein